MKLLRTLRHFRRPWVTDRLTLRQGVRRDRDSGGRDPFDNEVVVGPEDGGRTGRPSPRHVRHRDEARRTHSTTPFSARPLPDSSSRSTGSFP